MAPLARIVVRRPDRDVPVTSCHVFMRYPTGRRARGHDTASNSSILTLCTEGKWATLPEPIERRRERVDGDQAGLVLQATRGDRPGGGGDPRP